MKRSPATATVFMVSILLAGGCGQPQATLAPSLVGPATAGPLFFHGNCFAGWSVDVDLQLRETSGLAVLVDRLTYRLTDAGQARELANETLDAAALDARYQSHMIAPGGVSMFRLAGRSSAKPVGPVVLDCEVAGRDERDHFVSLRFQLTAASLIVSDLVPGQGGACSVGSSNARPEDWRYG